MNRRHFLTAGVAASVTSSFAEAAPVPASPPVPMKLGCQSAPTNEKHVAFLARYGVRNICGYPQIADSRLYATPHEFHRMLDVAGKYGVSVDCVAPPFLESSNIDREKHPAIMLAQSPERDRDIESMQTLIRNCAAGIPSIKYNMSILGVLRLPTRSPGRGDATYSTWRLKDARLPTRSPAPATSMPMPPGSASRISSTASFPSPTNTRSAWPAIPTTPASRQKATRASSAS